MTMVDTPLVSVCIPTFQHVNYIAQCLESVLRQRTSFPFEIIVGEDDSTDGTRQICEQYALKYPDKIRLFLRKSEEKIVINGKKTGRLNLIQNFKAAKGKYIAMLDGDDYWCDDEKLQKQVAFLEAHPDHAICFHPTYKNVNGKENRSTTTFRKWKEEKSFSILDIAAGDILMSTCTCMFRNNMSNDLPDWFWEIPFIDYALHTWNAQFGKVGFIPDCMSFYRMHTQSMWAMQPKTFRLRLMTDLLHIMIPQFSGDVQKALLKHQAKEYKKLLPFLLNEKDTDQIQFLIQRCAAYPHNFQSALLTDSLLTLHHKLHQTKSYQLHTFLVKARKLIPKW